MSKLNLFGLVTVTIENDLITVELEFLRGLTAVMIYHSWLIRMDWQRFFLLTVLNRWAEEAVRLYTYLLLKLAWPGGVFYLTNIRTQLPECCDVVLTHFSHIHHPLQSVGTYQLNCTVGLVKSCIELLKWMTRKANWPKRSSVFLRREEGREEMYFVSCERSAININHSINHHPSVNAFHSSKQTNIHDPLRKLIESTSCK